MDQAGSGPMVRQPRTIVQINGQAIPCPSWTSDSNSFYQADTFRADLPISALPAGFGTDYLASQAELDVEIFAGFPSDATGYAPSDLTSIFYGRVDDLAIDLRKGAATISGRDLTGLLIDSKTSEKYPNLTSSQIAQQIAAQVALTPVVTGTSTKVGKYYEIDNVRSQDERTLWDLLTWLAREEQFSVYVKGRELHFEPPGQGQTYSFTYTPPGDGPPQANATTITLSRNLTLAKDIKVTVRSWNAKNKKAFERTVTGSKARNSVTAGQGKSSSAPQQYTYTIPGLTPDQAQQRAQQLMLELSKHERKIGIEGPADVTLGPADMIQLQGTATDFDQTYYPDSIVRSMSRDDGFKWTISAKNHSPLSEPAL